MEVTIKIGDIINTKFAISPIKGGDIYKEIDKNITRAEVINIDFHGISNVTTAFLNRAIGNLYNKYEKELLDKKINYIGLDELDRLLLNRVISHALLTDEQKTILNNRIEEAMSDEQGD